VCNESVEIHDSTSFREEDLLDLCCCIIMPMFFSILPVHLFMTTEILADTLQKCVDPAETVRAQAQTHLEKLEQSLHYLPDLLALISENNTLAAVAFKNYIDPHWACTNNDARQYCKSNILSTLLLSSQVVRSTMANAVSKIAHIDWPESWPDLFENLCEMLKSHQELSVHGALLILADFVRDDVSDLQFPFIAPILVPQLFEIFKNNV
jgi:hypothetical protein